MKKGFALLEVLIAVTISALISMIIYQAFSQINASVRSLENSIDEHTKATLIAWHITKDFSGAFIPPRAIEERTKKNNPTDKNAPPDQKTQTPKNEEKEEKKEPIKPLTHIFYSINKNNNLQLITCITNNPLHVYWSESTGSAKPCIMRVVYQLKQEPLLKGKQPSYSLVRQESRILDLNAFKEDGEQRIREYEVANGIKKLTCSFLSAPPKKKEEQPAKKEAEKKTGPIEYKTFEQWDKEQQNQNKKDEEKADQDPIIPHFINISFTLWSHLQRSEKTFAIIIPIYPDVHYLPQEGSTSQPPPKPTPTDKKAPAPSNEKLTNQTQKATPVITPTPAGKP